MTEKRALKAKMAKLAADAIHANFIRTVQSADKTIDVKHAPDTPIVTVMVHDHNDFPTYFEIRIKEVQ